MHPVAMAVLITVVGQLVLALLKRWGLWPSLPH